MHRTHFVPCLVGWGAMLFTLAFLVGSTPAPARAQGPEITEKIEVAVGTTRTITSKFDLAKVQNDFPKILTIRAVPNKADQVMVDAVMPGVARITLTDVKGNSWIVEVKVISDTVRELKDLIKRTLPTSSIDVQATDTGTIVLSGWVLSADDVRAVAQLAASIEKKMISTAPNGASSTTQSGWVVNNVRMGGVQQVQLEVVVAVVNRSDARNLAFSWNVVGNNWIVNSLWATPLGVTQLLTPLSPGATSTGLTNLGTNNLSFGVLNGNSSILGFLQALRTEGLTKILAEPHLTTMSGRPARILSGGNVQIIASGAGSTAQLSADFGTIVNFLPVVLGNGKVHLEVAAEVSTPTTSIPIPGAGSPGTVSFSVLKRQANAAVEIEDGQTLAIGGLIQNTVNSTMNRVPVLGDIPGVGMLFSQSNYTVTEEEMIILVTPRLVDPVDCTKIPKHLPSQETRVPDDFELFCELILEAPRGQRQVGVTPHTYQPAFKNAPNIGQYPCAGGNCANPDTGCASGNCGTPRLSALPNTTGSATANSGPRYPEVSAVPTSNTRVVPDADLPQIPTVINAPAPIAPSLGVPAIPVPSSRDFETRPQLPPVPR
jgi:pilus assembly protein CpaC